MRCKRSFNVRKCFIVVCILQLLATTERQIFDFLGHLWLPILCNFFQLVLVIFGLFGVMQRQRSYLLAYSFWSFVWLAWNAFVICFYVEAGQLNRTEDLHYFNFGTGGISWFRVNGAGCRSYYPLNQTTSESDLFLQPAEVTNCWLDYDRVEVLKSSLQVLLTCVGVLSAVYLLYVDKIGCDDELKRSSSSSSSSKYKNHHSTSLYSIEYSSRNVIAADPLDPCDLSRPSSSASTATATHGGTAMRHHNSKRTVVGGDSVRGRLRLSGSMGVPSTVSTSLDTTGDVSSSTAQAAPHLNSHLRPLTPRRVKRRSISRSSARNSSSRNRSRNKDRPRSLGSAGAPAAATRPVYINPVTRLMERGLDSSTSNDSTAAGAMFSHNPGGAMGSGAHANPLYNSRPNSMHSFMRPTDISEAVNPWIVPGNQLRNHPSHAGRSHVNQSYVPDHNYEPPLQRMEPRPPSAHSSYSNYHGQRSRAIRGPVRNNAASSFHPSPSVTDSSGGGSNARNSLPPYARPEIILKPPAPLPPEERPPETVHRPQPLQQQPNNLPMRTPTPRQSLLSKPQPPLPSNDSGSSSQTHSDERPPVPPRSVHVNNRNAPPPTVVGGGGMGGYSNHNPPSAGLMNHNLNHNRHAVQRHNTTLSSSSLLKQNLPQFGGTRSGLYLPNLDSETVM